MAELLQALNAYPVVMVKILRRGHGSHGNIGRLLAVSDRWATVHPRNHKHAERVPLDQIRLWKSRTYS